MNALRIGRALGIGVRVAGRIVGRRVAGQPQTAQPRTVAAATAAVGRSRTAGQAAGYAAVQVGRGVKQGVGGFLGPFRRVGGIVWLEVTGLFFLLFALVFAWYMWQSWSAHVPHVWGRNAAISCVFMAVFLYLGISSFWRASRR